MPSNYSRIERLLDVFEAQQGAFEDIDRLLVEKKAGATLDYCLDCAATTQRDLPKTRWPRRFKR